MEETLKDNAKFDAKGLIAENPSFGSRLKFWTNEMCTRYPHAFDFVVTVR